MPTLLVGTRKGLFVLGSDDERREWAVSEPVLKGWEIFHAVPDPRDDSVYAATNSFVYGATVHRSQDRGKTWTRAAELAFRRRPASHLRRRGTSGLGARAKTGASGWAARPASSSGATTRARPGRRC